MKLAKAGGIAAAALTMATVVYGQTPNLSGTWTFVPAAAAPAGGGGGGRGMAGPMTITQTADTLTVERSMGDRTSSMVYKLDGSESVNKQTGRGGNEIEIKSAAKWDGGRLVISNKRTGPNGNVTEITETWSVEGDTLTIESTGGRGPAKRTYKRG